MENNKPAVKVELGRRFSVLTPRATFETRFSAQKRGARSWLDPVLTAGLLFSKPEAERIKHKLRRVLFFLLPKSCKIHIVKEMKRGSYKWQN